ncbi:MAG: type II toxin-antitoxin system prevent-host-death family antitoxin [Deltaproteobacteria bacterium]|nr:type II toxin-antitoxin system prevent-host-death family antitoxin [Deltaproteobacteria bacterium]
MSRPYPVHEAKAKLSEILRTVKAGRSVTISDRGRAVAQVVPIQPPRDLTARIEELERDGTILRARHDIDAIRPIARRRGALRQFLRSR